MCSIAITLFSTMKKNTPIAYDYYVHSIGEDNEPAYEVKAARKSVNGYIQEKLAKN